jgi:hypothetical protein
MKIIQKIKMVYFILYISAVVYSISKSRNPSSCFYFNPSIPKINNSGECDIIKPEKAPINFKQLNEKLHLIEKLKSIKISMHDKLKLIEKEEIINCNQISTPSRLDFGIEFILINID